MDTDEPEIISHLRELFIRVCSEGCGLIDGRRDGLAAVKLSVCMDDDRIGSMKSVPSIILFFGFHCPDLLNRRSRKDSPPQVQRAQSVRRDLEFEISDLKFFSARPLR
jgi:hypothetical protein